MIELHFRTTGKEWGYRRYLLAKQGSDTEVAA